MIPHGCFDGAIRQAKSERRRPIRADWGSNALVFRLTDDQGAAIRFESHPEFFTHKNALTAAQVRELVAYGQQRGVELIPEIESFGLRRTAS